MRAPAISTKVFARVLIAGAALTLAACTDPSATSPDITVLDNKATAPGQTAPNAIAEMNRDLAKLRAGVARYHSYEIADATGYTFLFPGPDGATCFQSSAGAMGRHYVNTALLDDVLDPATPEAVMYEPGPGGQLVLVGAEFVVPKDAWSGQKPPRLFGQTFDDGGTLWTLHVWAFKHNPTFNPDRPGIFEPWNPNVSCQYDAGKVGGSHH